MYLLGFALMALTCVPWEKIHEDTPPEQAITLCSGEVARMLRFSYNDGVPYRALLVVRADNTVAVQTTTHKNQLTMNDAQKETLREGLSDFDFFYRRMTKKPYAGKVPPSKLEGIDFYIEVRRGKKKWRWSNTRYEVPLEGTAPLFDTLEVLQYLLRP